MFALAVLARLWHVDLTRFFNDQVHFLQSASSFVDGGGIPLSSGLTFALGAPVRHPPLVRVLLAIPAVFSRSPVWVSAWVGVLDACTAPLVYLIALRISGRRFAGLAAGVLYALSPAVLIVGRMIWNPSLVPFFAAVGLLGLVDFTARGRTSSLAISLVAIGCTAELHLVNAIFLPLWLLAAAVGWRQLRLKPLALSGGALLLTLAPYLYLQTQSDWADVLNLWSYVRSPKVFDLSALDGAGGVAGVMMFRWQLPAPGDSPTPFGFDPLTWVLIALTLLGLALCLREPRWPRAIVALWLLLPVISQLRHTNTVIPQYLVGIVPAIAVLQALALQEGFAMLATPARKALPALAASTWERASGLAARASLIALAAALAASYAAFEGRVAGDVRQLEYGPPLRYSMAAASLVQSATVNQPLYLAAPPSFNEVVPFLAGREPYTWYEDRSVFVFPREAAWYLAQNGNFAHRFLTEHFGPPISTVDSAAGAPEYSLFKLPDHAEDRVLADPEFVPLQASVADALQLQGYLAGPISAGQPDEILLLWRVLDASRVPQDLSEFLRLVDPSGQTVSHDPDLWDMREPWRTGDQVAAAFDMDVATGTATGGYWLETGFYQTFSGQPLGSSVRAGPIKLEGSGPVSASPAAPPLATLGNGEIGLLDASWQGPDVLVDWTVLSKPRDSYTIFVHAVDGAGTLVRQWDGPPRDGSYPTRLWDVGEVVHDAYPLGLPPAPGLRLEIGMYTQPDIKRLLVRQPGSQSVTDHLTVAPPA